MDGRFQGMMTHMGGRFDAMQTHIDDQYSALRSRFDTVDNQLDWMYSQFVDLHTHIQDIVHDPIMNIMNNMQ
jgi:hypothetical protein